jgi:hypothetical protein
MVVPVSDVDTDDGTVGLNILGNITPYNNVSFLIIYYTFGN